MRADVPGEVSFSLTKLQRLARSFDQASAGAGTLDAGHAASQAANRERAALRLADELGATALPLCFRELGSEDEGRASWAKQVLAHLGRRPMQRARVLADLHGAVQRGGTLGLRALEILARLGPASDPEAQARTGSTATMARMGRPLRELIASMYSRAEIALAADRMMTELGPSELLELLDALSDGDPPRALLLADELLLRNDLDERSRIALRRMHAALDDLRRSMGGHAPSRLRGERRPESTIQIGRHDSGRMVVVVSQPVPGKRRPRLRVLCVLASSATGPLLDGLHGDEVVPARLEREVIEPLRRRGYRFADASPTQAARLVRRAAQASIQLGRPLPQAFYLGRDLLGIYHQHARNLHAADSKTCATALLDRALDLLAAGQVRRARPILERHVAQAPESVEGFAALARCLMELGELDQARTHLLRATWLEPGNPLHYWNLSAVAHRQGRHGGCYLALRDYLELVGQQAFDQAAGAIDVRRKVALEFVAEYERLARLEHPEVEPEAVAQADDLLHRARVRLHAARWQEAIPMLEHALTLAPSHYPSWAHLGIAHGECSSVDEALRCLHQALRLRPSYPLAVTALAHLEARRELMPALRSKSRQRLSESPTSAEEGQQAP